MAKVHTLKNRTPTQLAIIRSFTGEPAIRIGDREFVLQDLNPTIQHFNEFWELMDAVKKHGYLRASMSVIGRSAVGAWWYLHEHPEFEKSARKIQRRRLYNFYMYSNRSWSNIKDFQNFAGKLLIGVQYLRYFGQAAFEIIRDQEGNALGLDFLSGFVVPNVDDKGNFKTPAFIQYPSSDPTVKVEFKNPTDIVYLHNPDWEGSPTGGTDIEALSDFTLPLDIYLMTAAREYMKNRDKPEVVYQVAPDISDDSFAEFVAELEARHSGAKNMGRNPIAVQGDFKIHELKPLPDALPYMESRTQARDELLAVSGVSGAKLGLTEKLSLANLRELRREFHETNLMPLLRQVELSLYEQVHLREFDSPGWEIKFNNPDFLNAVEQATVHMRYRQMGAMTPNEVRNDLGLKRRTDPGGDEFMDDDNDGEIPENQGSPPEGRPVEPDAPAQVGEPNDDDSDPERGDQHSESDRALSELRTWKRFALKRIERGKSLRPFVTTYVPQDINDLIESYLSKAVTPEAVAAIFDNAISELEELL